MKTLILKIVCFIKGHIIPCDIDPGNIPFTMYTGPCDRCGKDFR